ncbi:phosphatidate phosphatase APP1 [Yoonia maricola]|uniref:Phosphatidate phosphatase APP1 n=1 Tax=Yoonia maricola TaxID=420999 RepID=A0A2M8W0K8_9RHOB|nr:phosphatase domain-containing protein [Yoonia maricola]PJI84459.1 phosphatidate phosphatase APP1 [Yoonia maricola]
MAVKLALAGVAHIFERGFEKIRHGAARDDPIINCYGGYTTPDHIVLRGRVLAKARAISPVGPQSKWRNFKDFLSLFATDELRDLMITAPDFDLTTQTDEEGFFTLRVPATGDVPAFVNIQAAGASEVHPTPVFNAHAAAFGVISDIDDTLLRTGAYSLIRNLWTSATGNVHQREVFDDAVALLRDLKGKGAACFYVSSSPWNLYDYLQAVFVRTGLPLGPYFLRDLGISQTQFVTGTHGDHKTEAIETILAASPHLQFTLVGDTGQHDPHIYADIVARHQDRIAQVILRRPSDAELSSATKSDAAKIKAAGVKLMLDYDYRSLLGNIET